MIESLVSAVGQRGVDAAAFLLAFALTALTDSLFHNKLPHDHGREFAVNGGLSKGKARGSGLIFVLCIALVSMAFLPFKVEYVIYTVLLMISTTGLPVAMSRMISEARALNNGKQVRQIYRVSLMAFLSIGIIGSALMLIIPKQLANMMENPNAMWSIFALGPAVLFVCYFSACRGCHDVERMYDPKKPLIGAIHKGMGPNAEKKVDCLACHPTAGHNYGYVIPFKAAAN